MNVHVAGIPLDNRNHRDHENLLSSLPTYSLRSMTQTRTLTEIDRQQSDD